MNLNIAYLKHPCYPNCSIYFNIAHLKHSSYPNCSIFDLLLDQVTITYMINFSMEITVTMDII